MSAYIIAIEGGDGVGKNTVSHALTKILISQGFRTTVIDFPRYSETLAGSALGQFLSGSHKRVVTPKVAAVLYALDRLEFQPEIEQAKRDNDFIIFDRYIASNVAYQGAKVATDKTNAFMEWIAHLEVETLGICPANLNVLLSLDADQAKDLIAKKEVRTYTDLKYDLHEADDDLQRTLRLNYERLISTSHLGEWLKVTVSADGTLRTPKAICDEILSHLVAIPR